jgi:hypothetical protein
MSWSIAVCLALVLWWTVACNEHAPTTVPSSLERTVPTASPRPPRAPLTFDVTGVVTDDVGAPVPDAFVKVWLDYEDLASGMTDTAGSYRLHFSGVPGANHWSGVDPGGTEDAVGFLTVDGNNHTAATGFEFYSRYLIGSGEHLIENVRLSHIKRTTSGEATTVTMTSNDSVCGLDTWPARVMICGIARVVTTRSGIMRVEAVPLQAGLELPGLMVNSSQGIPGLGRGNPTIILVAAGTEYMVYVERPWGFLGSQSFVVNPSFSR